jgi:hypothetical protein
MTLLRQGRSGSALLDQLTAETIARRGRQKPTIAKRFIPIYKDLPARVLSPFAGIYYQKRSCQWVWRVRKRNLVIRCGMCNTSWQAHEAYLAAKNEVMQETIAQQRFDKRPHPVQGEPRMGPRPVIRMAGRLTITDVQRTVGWYFGFKHEDIIGDSRKAYIVFPRHIAVYLSKILTTLSFPQISRRFGGRDHTTALHAARRIADILEGTQTCKRKAPFREMAASTTLADDIAALKELLK